MNSARIADLLLAPERMLTGLPPTLRRALRVAVPIYASEIDPAPGTARGR